MILKGYRFHNGFDIKMIEDQRWMMMMIMFSKGEQRKEDKKGDSWKYDIKGK